MKKHRTVRRLAGIIILLWILIPFVTASIIDQGIEAGNMQKVYP